MATFTSNCDGSANSFENNGNIRVTYTAGNGSVTITEIEGMRTDGYSSYEDTAQTIKITLGGVEKTINVTRVRFMANSAYATWGLTDTTWTGFNGKVDFKLHGLTHWSGAAYYNKSFSESQVIDAGYSQQYFDLNGSLDGTAQGGISPMGTADVTIAGTKVLDSGTDYYTQHPVGSSYTVNDIKTNAGYTYTGESSYTGTMSSSGTTTVVLPFTTNSYTVAYNANGGSSTPSTQTAKYNTAVTLAAKISRANSDSNATITITYNANGGSGAPGNSTGTAVNTTPYTFSKWALNSTSGTKYDAGASYTIPAANSTMYATWTTGTTTRKSNPSITLSSTKPTRSGYTFKGWSTSSTATTASYNAGTAYTFSANTTLYAVWEAGPHGNIYVKQNGAWVLVSNKYQWANR